MKLIIILASLVCLGNNICLGEPSAKITLFYESLCPYCIKFVTQQLYETTLAIPNFVKLDLVPYGKAKRELVDDQWRITCQHGPEECYGNTVHACVLEQAKSKPVTKLVTTLKCLMKSNYTNPEILKCISVGNFNYTRYSRCMINLRTNLTLKYAERTEKNIPKVTFVPLVMINDHHNKTLDDKATKNLLGTICSLLDHVPENCKNNEYENYISK